MNRNEKSGLKTRKLDLIFKDNPDELTYKWGAKNVSIQ